VNGQYDKSKNTFGIQFKAGNTVFGNKSAGSPFYVYAMNPYKGEALKTWNYSVIAGDTLNDEWSLDSFDNGQYHFRAYGPNGFYREFRGNTSNPLVKIDVAYERGRIAKDKLTGNITVTVKNADSKPHTILVADNSYKGSSQTKTIAPGTITILNVPLSRSHGWYDHSVKVKGYEQYEERFAGRVENGEPGKTDPLMGRVV
jgi:phospholipase C